MAEEMEMAAAPFNPEAGAGDSLTAYLDAHQAIIRSECAYAELPRHRVRTLHPGLPCDSCGSVEYVPHSGLMICSYCRTPQEGVKCVRLAPDTAPQMSKLQGIERRLRYEDYMAARKREAKREAEIKREQVRAASFGYLWGSIFR